MELMLSGALALPGLTELLVPGLTAALVVVSAWAYFAHLRLGLRGGGGLGGLLALVCVACLACLARVRFDLLSVVAGVLVVLVCSAFLA